MRFWVSWRGPYRHPTEHSASAIPTVLRTQRISPAMSTSARCFLDLPSKAFKVAQRLLNLLFWMSRTTHDICLLKKVVNRQLFVLFIAESHRLTPVSRAGSIRRKYNMSKLTIFFAMLSRHVDLFDITIRFGTGRGFAYTNCNASGSTATRAVRPIKSRSTQTR